MILGDLQERVQCWLKIIEFFDFEDYTLYYYISEEVIRQLQDYVNWKYVSKYSSLSEEFIREFQDKLNK